jgi:hypothetical protein
VFDLLNAGALQCNEHLYSAVTASWLRTWIGIFIQDSQQRLLILPTVARLLRCNSDDIVAINHLLNETGAMSSPPTPRRSIEASVPSAAANATLVNNGLLGIIIAAGEFAQFDNNPLTLTEVGNMDKGLNVEMPADTALFEPLDADGYVPYNDSLSHHYPDTNVNLLMIQGLLDSNAPAEWADYASEFYTGMNQRLFFYPLPCTLRPRGPTSRRFVREDRIVATRLQHLSIILSVATSAPIASVTWSHRISLASKKAPSRAH